MTQCVTINLTLIYAILAYYGLKKTKVVAESETENLVAVRDAAKCSDM